MNDVALRIGGMATALSWHERCGLNKERQHGMTVEFGLLQCRMSDYRSFHFCYHRVCDAQRLIEFTSITSMELA